MQSLAFDFSYGFRGLGNLDRLKEDSGGMIEVTKVEKVECQGEKISSLNYKRKIGKRISGRNFPLLLVAPMK